MPFCPCLPALCSAQTILATSNGSHPLVSPSLFTQHRSLTAKNPMELDHRSERLPICPLADRHQKPPCPTPPPPQISASRFHSPHIRIRQLHGKPITRHRRNPIPTQKCTSSPTC